MGPIHNSRVYAAMGVALLVGTSAACDDGVVSLVLLTAGHSDMSDDAGSQTADTSAAGDGAAADRAGVGGSWDREPHDGSPSGSSRPDRCEDMADSEKEAALVEALNRAILSGRFCPHNPPGLRSALTVQPPLRDLARGWICSVFVGGPTWTAAPRYPPLMTWALSGTSNLEDAKTALLEGERDALCQAAERTSYKDVGIGQIGESWSILVSAPIQDDMQKP